MTTLFDILNTLNNNNNNNNYTGCKRQYSINKRVDIIPSMDVTLTNDKLIIETELTGVSKNDIDINIKDSILIIQGEKKKSIIKNQQQQQQQQQLENSNNKENDEPSIEEFEEDVKSKSELNKTTLNTTENKDEDKTTQNINKEFISERSFGNFKRYLNLSEILYQLDLNSIDTQFENGLLTITIKKKFDSSNTIKININ
ncbi:heat shock protein Hsp20 domain-containing protein [Dictyostelium discoideum AX4]|uniref:Small heat shock protein hspG4 n=1 Tax=Dictyostelium discoideum TaxID=44689 RepID=HSPG4_DICDI|nr:heat shock protein Hsp20 domain-containing protein [Dictyostelium discoideum AX4]Q551G1.1 RecName: Full=Small heat shock protein hspG4 [Dictyostelium discoideum]EAL69150.1 heat shock protein Hsp20 domain-containing protein [Dictyostelium discoideum AX4]|eukprot:XP_643076.1 heat shock protein Hsp20 domain-containing protein [Dictyostelium discoideum AX4]